MDFLFCIFVSSRNTSHYRALLEMLDSTNMVAHMTPENFKYIEPYCIVLVCIVSFTSRLFMIHGHCLGYALVILTRPSTVIKWASEGFLFQKATV